MKIPDRAGMSAFAIADNEYQEDEIITAVTEDPDGQWYSLRMDSSGIGFAKSYDGNPPHGIVPKVGDTFRFYGRTGFKPRGIAINGVIAYWHTPEEENELHREEV